MSDPDSIPALVAENQPLQAGEFCVVSRGVEHRTMADTEAEVLVFEPAHTRNTGNILDETFTAPNGIVI
jgi:quercetin dioxygenase-like cupin family protein